MSEISFNDLAVIFTDDSGKDKEILNCTDLFMNKSRIPFHALESDTLTIIRLINNTAKETKNIFSGITDYEFMKVLLFNALFTSQLVKASKPFKIAEIGSTDGLISYQLTQITGTVSPESHIYFISNVIGNDSSNNCLNAVSAASCYPQMSFVYSDYEDIGLKSDYFDITIINGSALFNNHYDVVSEAHRITRNGGIIICLNAEDHLLDSTFRLIFPEREEYRLKSSDALLTAVSNDSAWAAYDPLDISAEYESLLQQAEEARSGNDKFLLRKLIAKADALADEAVKLHDTELKIKLISIKERLIDRVCQI